MLSYTSSVDRRVLAKQSPTENKEIPADLGMSTIYVTERPKWIESSE
jgi:hypothetical protein